MSDPPATKEDVRQIIHSEVQTLREDVIRPIQVDVRHLQTEIYGESGRNGIKTKVKENLTLRSHVYWLWGTIISAVIIAAAASIFSGPSPPRWPQAATGEGGLPSLYQRGTRRDAPPDP